MEIPALQGLGLETGILTKEKMQKVGSRKDRLKIGIPCEVSNEECRVSVAPAGVMTLVDCLANVGRLSPDLAEKFLTGAMMIALSNGAMTPLEVRWASMLGSAAGLSHDDFQRCCASARVIAAMLRPPAGAGA